MKLFKILKSIATHPLNNDKKLEAVIRFAKWQIGSRLVPGAVVYNWIHGAKFIVENGETGLTGNIYTGLIEFEDMGFLLHFLRAGDLFVDVGANSGAYSILAGAVVGADGYAFEPVPESYRRLCDNIRINALEERVKCICCAVGDREGEVAFTMGYDTTNHVVQGDEPTVGNLTSKMTSLDCALAAKDPSLIKIDVEGYETKVLEGAAETLSKESLRAVIMELNGSGKRYGFDESRIVKKMRGFGFETCFYNPINRRINTLTHETLDCQNTLFIRDWDFVTDRLKSAPEILVHGVKL